ncbi:hypothetical protein EV673_0190 [Limnobacter thiooxidans]|nr:hypothetical protein EV673_0190 [Limnobacter thiooxidans]
MLVILETLVLAAIALISFLILRRIYRFLFSRTEVEPTKIQMPKLEQKSTIDFVEDVASYGVIAALIAKAGMVIASPGIFGAALMWLGLANVPLILTVGPVVGYFSAGAVAVLAGLKLYGKHKLRTQRNKQDKF